MILHANGNVSMLTANSTLFIGNTSISNAGISVSGSTISPFGGMRNRIINGAMVIDQRNSGATGTASQITVDRWWYLGSQVSKGTWGQNLNSVTPPAGFSKYLGWQTGASAYSLAAADYFCFYQVIEGNNFYDLDFGKSTAKTLTLSFWVRSSLTGQFGGCLDNNDESRVFPFSYTINSANTWEYKTITIPGDITGTWAGATNAAAGFVLFSLGVGSNQTGPSGAWTSASTYINSTGSTSVVGSANATWYVTGVQLEAGSTASPFEFRQYGTELALCQRYFQKNTSGDIPFGAQAVTSYMWWAFPVRMRAAPTFTDGGTGRQSGTTSMTEGLYFYYSGSYAVIGNNSTWSAEF